MRRRAIDLYCCAGGASKGLADAGFELTGVDKDPQPSYPFTFIQADARDILADHAFLAQFDLIAASPPCHDHTPLSALSGLDGTGELLEVTRGLLMAQPVPWVLENVAAAPLRADFLLCGAMFGLRTYRHRRFEIDPRLPLLLAPPPHPRHVARTATKRRRERWAEGWNVSVSGDVGVYVGPEALGIDWMTGDQLSQAIPPAYTKFIGLQLLDVLREAA
jgi:DNA (cytosine-5)-methyltransferase 1